MNEDEIKKLEEIKQEKMNNYENELVMEILMVESNQDQECKKKEQKELPGSEEWEKTQQYEEMKKEWKKPNKKKQMEMEKAMKQEEKMMKRQR